MRPLVTIFLDTVYFPSTLFPFFCLTVCERTAPDHSVVVPTVQWSVRWGWAQAPGWLRPQSSAGQGWPFSPCPPPDPGLSRSGLGNSPTLTFLLGSLFPEPALPPAFLGVSVGWGSGAPPEGLGGAAHAQNLSGRTVHLSPRERPCRRADAGSTRHSGGLGRAECRVAAGGWVRGGPPRGRGRPWDRGGEAASPGGCPDPPPERSSPPWELGGQVPGQPSAGFAMATVT